MHGGAFMYTLAYIMLFKALAEQTPNRMSKHLYFAVCVSILSGCSGIPKDAFLLSPSNLEDKRVESRIFATTDKPALLKDSAVILENMGYKTDLVNTDIGLITATKLESEGGLASTVMSILSAGLAATNKDQVVRATFTVLPSKGRNNAFITRLKLQRIVFNSDGEATSAEPIMDEKIYKIFYERLEASLFIEAGFI